MVPGGCRGPGGAAGFLGAVRAAGVIRAAPGLAGPPPPGRCGSLARSARRFRPARPQASSLVRVIAPAHREEDSAVSARLRAARDRARPRASSRPSAHRAARSRPASDPRWRPAARSTASSCGEGRSRARTRTPPGAAATNGAATRRSDPVTSPPPRGSPRVSAHVFGNDHPARIVARTCFRYLRHTAYANGSNPGHAAFLVAVIVALVDAAASFAWASRRTAESG